MRIGGLQKMTLLDYPGKVACTVFLPGCNFRCPYCHNSALVLPERMEAGFPQQELLDFLETRKGKLDGVCITGGEPTIHRDLPELIGRIRSLGFLVKLDTNGSNPVMLQKLMEDRAIDYVAMDIKNSPQMYAATCGNPFLLEKVEQSVQLLMEGSVGFEFRTTVCKPLHTQQSMTRLGRWIQGTEKYYIQNFQDSGSLVGSGMKGFSQQELDQLLQAVKPWVPAAQLRGI